jgi:crossover junction endodeoxyribonuclease RuvC
MRSINHRNRNTNERALLAERAAELRARATGSESRLWAAVRARQLGVLFRRQVPIAGYIVDLVAPAARLVVEIDGGCHAERRSADARRDAVLQRLGYRVLRVDAAHVERKLGVVVQQIRRALSQD